MGGISLPALHIQPPAEQPDVLQQYGRIMQLRNMAQEAPLRQQALQQNVQTGQVENQKAQLGLQDEQAKTSAMQSWDGKSLDDLAGLVQKNGGSASAVMGLKKQSQDLKEQASKIARDDAETGSKVLDTHIKQNQAVTGALQNVLSVSDEQLPQAIMSTTQDLVQRGILDQTHAQAAAKLAQLGDPTQMRSGLDSMRKGLMSSQDILDQAKQQETVRHNQASETNTAVENANTTAYRKAELGQGAQRISVEQARLAFEQKKASLDQLQSGATGSEFLATLPAGIQPQIKAMANGDIAIPPAGTRNPQAQALRAAVLQYDPTYTDARYKGKQDFKNKGDSQNLVQLSTAMEHADHAITNSAKVGFAPALGNKTLEAPESAAYMQDAEFLTGEVGKLVKNGVLTVDESTKISSGLTSARQNVRDAALKETMDLLGGKARAVFQKYKTGTGQDLPVGEFFDQKTQQRLSKYGIVEGSSSGGNDLFSQFGGKAH